MEAAKHTKNGRDGQRRIGGSKVESQKDVGVRGRYPGPRKLFHASRQLTVASVDEIPLQGNGRTNGRVQKAPGVLYEGSQLVHKKHGAAMAARAGEVGVDSRRAKPFLRSLREA